MLTDNEILYVRFAAFLDIVGRTITAEAQLFENFATGGPTHVLVGAEKTLNEELLLVFKSVL